MDILNYISFFRSSTLTNVEIEVVESGKLIKIRSSIVILLYTNINWFSTDSIFADLAYRITAYIYAVGSRLARALFVIYFSYVRYISVTTVFSLNRYIRVLYYSSTPLASNRSPIRSRFDNLAIYYVKANPRSIILIFVRTRAAPLIANKLRIRSTKRITLR